VAVHPFVVDVEDRALDGVYDVDDCRLGYTAVICQLGLSNSIALLKIWEYKVQGAKQCDMRSYGSRG